MTTWLVCKRCKIQEAILPTTPIIGCQTCGAARYAVNDDGQPMVIFSKIHDFDSWDDNDVGQSPRGLPATNAC
jgi:hypothetical protein